MLLPNTNLASSDTTLMHSVNSLRNMNSNSSLSSSKTAKTVSDVIVNDPLSLFNSSHTALNNSSDNIDSTHNNSNSSDNYWHDSSNDGGIVDLTLGTQNSSSSISPVAQHRQSSNSLMTNWLTTRKGTEKVMNQNNGQNHDHNDSRPNDYNSGRSNDQNAKITNTAHNASKPSTLVHISSSSTMIKKKNTMGGGGDDPSSSDDDDSAPAVPRDSRVRKTAAPRDWHDAEYRLLILWERNPKLSDIRTSSTSVNSWTNSLTRGDYGPDHLLVFCMLSAISREYVNPNQAMNTHCRTLSMLCESSDYYLQISFTHLSLPLLMTMSFEQLKTWIRDKRLDDFTTSNGVSLLDGIRSRNIVPFAAHRAVLVDLIQYVGVLFESRPTVALLKLLVIDSDPDDQVTIVRNICPEIYTDESPRELIRILTCFSDLTTHRCIMSPEFLCDYVDQHWLYALYIVLANRDIDYSWTYQETLEEIIQILPLNPPLTLKVGIFLIGTEKPIEYLYEANELFRIMYPSFWYANLCVRRQMTLGFYYEKSQRAPITFEFQRFVEAVGGVYPCSGRPDFDHKLIVVAPASRYVERLADRVVKYPYYELDLPWYATSYQSIKLYVDQALTRDDYSTIQKEKLNQMAVVHRKKVNTSHCIKSDFLTISRWFKLNLPWYDCTPNSEPGLEDHPLWSLLYGRNTGRLWGEIHTTSPLPGCTAPSEEEFASKVVGQEPTGSQVTSNRATHGQRRPSLDYNSQSHYNSSHYGEKRNREVYGYKSATEDDSSYYSNPQRRRSESRRSYSTKRRLDDKKREHYQPRNRGDFYTHSQIRDEHSHKLSREKRSRSRDNSRHRYIHDDKSQRNSMCGRDGRSDRTNQNVETISSKTVDQVERKSSTIATNSSKSCLPSSVQTSSTQKDTGMVDLTTFKPLFSCANLMTVSKPQHNMLFTLMNNCHLMESSVSQESPLKKYLYEHTTICWSEERPPLVGDLLLVTQCHHSIRTRILRSVPSWDLLSECDLAVYQVASIDDRAFITGLFHQLLYQAVRLNMVMESASQLDWPRILQVPPAEPAYMTFQQEAHPPAVHNTVDIISFQPANNGRSSVSCSSSVNSATPLQRTTNSVSHVQENIVNGSPNRGPLTNDDTSSNRMNSSNLTREIKHEQDIRSPSSFARLLPDASSTTPFDPKAGVRYMQDLAGTTIYYGVDSTIMKIEKQSAFRSLAGMTRISTLTQHCGGEIFDNCTIENMCNGADYDWQNRFKTHATGGPQARPQFMSLGWYALRLKLPALGALVLAFEFPASRRILDGSLRLSHFLSCDELVAGDVKIMTYKRFLSAWRGIAETYGALYHDCYRTTMKTFISEFEAKRIGFICNVEYLECWLTDILHELYFRAQQMDVTFTTNDKSLTLTPKTMTPEDWCRVMASEFEWYTLKISVTDSSSFTAIGERILCSPIISWPEIRSASTENRPARTPKGPKGSPPSSPTIPAKTPQGTQPKVNGKDTKGKGGDGIYPCVSDLQRVYKIKGKDGKFPICQPNCRYIHHDNLKGTKKSKAVSAVKTIGKSRLNDTIVAALNTAIAQDSTMI